jgi:hypothetical protein
MTVTFRPAVRENVPLLIGIAGGTGSGKTYSALRVATGIAGGKKFAVIDTENGRARHYADMFDFDVADLTAPFRPGAYADAITAADQAGYPVIVIDSMSHEHDGDGGLLDWHEEEYQRLGGRDAVKFTAWIKPKDAHKKMVTRLLQVKAHVILCFRAAEKIEIVKVAGKTEVRPKQSVVGLDGWVPISEPKLPYELTLSLLLTADKPGVGRPIKLQEQHRPLVPLDRPLDETVGEKLAAWAAGGAPPAALPQPTAPTAAKVEDVPFGETVEAITDPQARKLNVLVGKLLDAGHITREQLYAALARERQIDAGLMIAMIDGARDENGLHWGPLRDSLSKTEASALIERLSALEERAAA